MTADNPDPSPDPAYGPLGAPYPPSGPLPPPPPGVPMSGPPMSGPPMVAPDGGVPVAAAPPARSRGTVAAVGIAALALVLAVVALGLAWRSLDQANDARDIALAGGDPAVAGPPGDARPTPEASTQPEPAPPTDVPASEEPVPGEAPITPDEPVLNEQTRYAPAYTKEQLNLQAPCGYTSGTDLDEPRVGVDSNHELVFNARCGGDASSLSLPDGVEGARVDSPAITPFECAERIRRGKLPDEGSVPVRKGAVMCVKTARTAAAEQGETQKMVVLEVLGATDSGSATVQVTAWNIPG